MGLVMCSSPGKRSRLSLLGEVEYSASCDIGRGKLPFEEARDSVEVSLMKTQWLKNSVKVPVKKRWRLKSSISRSSGTSPSVIFERVTSGTGRDMFLSEGSSSDGVGREFCWSPPFPSVTDSYSILPMTKVHSNLYIGNEENSNDEHLLNSKGITHILSLIGHQSSIGKVERKQCPMHDKGRSDIKRVLDEVYEFMESGQKDNNNLLVHCRLGQNRSAVVVIAFLIKKFKITLHRAHRDLKALRPLVQVNVDYAKQLLDFEREYLGNNSLPLNWMEREYNEAANDLIYKHEDLSTVRQREMFANIEDK